MHLAFLDFARSRNPPGTLRKGDVLPRDLFQREALVGGTNDIDAVLVVSIGHDKVTVFRCGERRRLAFEKPSSHLMGSNTALLW